MSSRKLASHVNVEGLTSEQLHARSQMLDRSLQRLAGGSDPEPDPNALSADELAICEQRHYRTQRGGRRTSLAAMHARGSEGGPIYSVTVRGFVRGTMGRNARESDNGFVRGMVRRGSGVNARLAPLAHACSSFCRWIHRSKSSRAIRRCRPTRNTPGMLRMLARAVLSGIASSAATSAGRRVWVTASAYPTTRLATRPSKWRKTADTGIARSNVAPICARAKGYSLCYMRSFLRPAR
jgi:hypothetical protein